MEPVSDNAMTEQLTGAARLVVKIGSALLVDDKTGTIRRTWLEALADDLHVLRETGTEILVVSSGAIAVGRRHLGLTQKTIRLEEKQAAAASGQIQLAHAYQEALARHDISVAQILLTLSDTEERRRHLNARSTIAQLLTLGAVPVVNENDTVATTEIRFGDNDRLAARVAAMISADTLILLSDIDGLYERDPRQDSNAKHIAQVDEINPQIEAMAGKAPTGYSSGGMETKIQAAKVATAAGCRMAIMNGIDANPLRRLTEGARCTWFMPSTSPLTARKRWIVGSLNPVGEILVDAGAERALKQGKSLLPAGVIRIQGTFERGDAVIVRAADGNEMARGLSAYSNVDAARIAGRKSGEIAEILGYRGRDELIHRDDLVLIV
jgi:glutamate 5-kinase